MRLTDYQRAWIADAARYKAVIKSRRVGYSEATCLECAFRASGIAPITRERCRPAHQLIVSAGQEQSRELLARIVTHIRAFEKISGRTLLASVGVELVRMVNGSVLRALSTNPRSIRQYEGDLFLDEFAHVPNDMEFWRAAKSCTDPTLGTPEGYRVRVVSTPNGDDNLFFRICETDAGTAFSIHRLTIHDAIAHGFPADLDQLRAETPDPDMFSQEYECSFLSASMRYIPASTYDACVYDELPTTGLLYRCAAGMDVARHAHNTAIVQIAKLGDVYWVLPSEAKRNMEWADQEQWASDVIAQIRGKMAIDVTGIGSQFGERLVAMHRTQVEPVTFTRQTKEMLATGLRVAFERSRIRVPREDAALRRDVMSLRREVTAAGNVRYDAPETADGHADRAWALALAVYAAGGTVVDRGATRLAETGAPRITESLYTGRHTL